MKLSIHNEDRPWEDSACFWIVAEYPDGTRKIAKPMQFEFVEYQKGLSLEPSFNFSGWVAREFFPALQEAMIRSGVLKPTKNEQIESIKYHLEDMRKLVFK